MLYLAFSALGKETLVSQEIMDCRPNLQSLVCRKDHETFTLENVNLNSNGLRKTVSNYVRLAPDIFFMFSLHKPM